MPTELRNTAEEYEVARWFWQSGISLLLTELLGPDAEKSLSARPDFASQGLHIVMDEFVKNSLVKYSMSPGCSYPVPDLTRYTVLVRVQRQSTWKCSASHHVITVVASKRDQTLLRLGNAGRSGLYSPSLLPPQPRDCLRVPKLTHLAFFFPVPLSKPGSHERQKKCDKGFISSFRNAYHQVGTAYEHYVTGRTHSEEKRSSQGFAVAGRVLGC
ncbi:hypothetical protein BJV78DRAFT_1157006 [Lactifluus subvellereus]|nr:hypothetical protein BJV78DRAFT_1157006 [Lactifluus subvellereus]